MFVTCNEKENRAGYDIHAHARMHAHTHARTHTHTQVTAVVLFDFPNTIVDYLHRVGRTGRVGSQAGCKTTAFMTHKRDVRMAWKIKVSHRQSTNWTEVKHDHSRSLIRGTGGLDLSGTT